MILVQLPYHLSMISYPDAAADLIMQVLESAKIAS